MKLLDFGIAKLLEGDGRTTAPSEMTRLGGAAMTPEYAAPEQLQRAEVTTATDVYALGVLLYVLLVGRHPTASEAITPIEQMQALAEGEPVRLSDAAMEADGQLLKTYGMSALQLARTLRGDLDNIIAKALQKSPADRYTTADAFAGDLKRYLNDEPVSARAESRDLSNAEVRSPASTRSRSCRVDRARARRGHCRHDVASDRSASPASGSNGASARKCASTRRRAVSSTARRGLQRVHEPDARRGRAGRPAAHARATGRSWHPAARPQIRRRSAVRSAHAAADVPALHGSGQHAKSSQQVLARALAIAQEQDDPDLLADVECTIVRTQTDANRYDSAEQHMQECTDRARARTERGSRDQSRLPARGGRGRGCAARH